VWTHRAVVLVPARARGPDASIQVVDDVGEIELVRWSMTLERSSLRPRLAKVRFVAWVTAARAISSLYLLLVGNRSSALPQACWLQ
jgi:hypothetical protein